MFVPFRDGSFFEPTWGSIHFVHPSPGFNVRHRWRHKKRKGYPCLANCTPISSIRGGMFVATQFQEIVYSFGSRDIYSADGLGRF